MLRTVMIITTLLMASPAFAKPVLVGTPRAEAEALRDKVVPIAELNELAVLMNSVGAALNLPENRANDFANHRKAYPIYTKLTTAYAYASVGRQDRNRKFFNKYAAKVRVLYKQACDALEGC